MSHGSRRDAETAAREAAQVAEDARLMAFGNIQEHQLAAQQAAEQARQERREQAEADREAAERARQEVQQSDQLRQQAEAEKDQLRAPAAAS